MRDLMYALLSLTIVHVKATPKGHPPGGWPYQGECHGPWCPPQGGQLPTPPISQPVIPPVTQPTYVPPEPTYVPPGQSEVPPVPPPESYVPPPPPNPTLSAGGPVPSVPSGPNLCSGSSTFEVSWSGDVVQLGTLGTTTGCTDLSTYPGGRIYVGDSKGTLLEWSAGNANPMWDVSFVEGYSVPLTCYGTSSSGCPFPVSGDGSPSYLVNPSYGPLSSPEGKYAGNPGAYPWCLTCTAQGAPWDQCSGSAYTFPYDDAAMAGPDNSIRCCVGKGCAPTGREGDSAKVGGNPQDATERPPPGEPCALCTGGATKRGLQAAMMVGNATDVTEIDVEKSLSGVTEDLRRHIGHKRRHRPGGSNPWSPVNPNSGP